MNDEVVLLASVARTAETTSDLQFNPRFRGGHVVIDVTADPASASVTPSIEGYDVVSGKYYTLLTGAAITATGTTVLKIYPGITATENVSVSDVLPLRWRFKMAVADTDSITYSVSFKGVQ